MSVPHAWLELLLFLLLCIISIGLCQAHSSSNVDAVVCLERLGLGLGSRDVFETFLDVSVSSRSHCHGLVILTRDILCYIACNKNKKVVLSQR